MSLNANDPIGFNNNLADMIEKNASDVSEGIREYLHTELLEGSFARSILKPIPITTAECQVNLTDNSLYVVREIESDAAAIAVDNLGTPNGRYIKGARYMIPIVNFVTDRFQITEDDLRAYRHPLTKRIQEKSVPILHKLEDKYFLRLVGAAIAGQTALLGTGKAKIVKGTNAQPLEIDARDMINLKNILASGIGGSDDKRKEVATLLMTQEDFETVTLLPNVGDDFGKDRIINGVQTETLYGTNVIRTIKSNILPRGHVFAFTSEDFLGHAFSLGETRFEINKRFGLIEWETRMSLGYGIGNITAAALLTMDGSVMGSTDLECATTGTVPSAISSYYAGLEL